MALSEAEELELLELEEAEYQAGQGALPATPAQPEAPGMLDLLKKAATKLNPARTPLNPKDLFKPSNVSRMVGQPQPVSNLNELVANNAQALAAGGASVVIPGSGLAALGARTGLQAGLAAGLAPSGERTKQAASAGAVNVALEAIPYGLGKLGPRIASGLAKASGVPVENYGKIFKNPGNLLSGPSKEEAKEVFEAAAKKAGLSSEVSDDVLYKSAKKKIKETIEKIRAKERLSNQELLDARQMTDDLIESAKRGGKKNKFRGFVQRRAEIQKQLAEQAPEIREADKVFTQYKTREPFLNAMPIDKLGNPSLAKAAWLQLGFGVPTGGLATLAGSPIIGGLGTAATGAVAKAAPAFRSASSATLQAIRNYIQNEQSR